MKIKTRKPRRTTRRTRRIRRIRHRRGGANAMEEVADHLDAILKKIPDNGEVGENKEAAQKWVESIRKGEVASGELPDVIRQFRRWFGSSPAFDQGAIQNFVGSRFNGLVWK